MNIFNIFKLFVFYCIFMIVLPVCGNAAVSDSDKCIDKKYSITAEKIFQTKGLSKGVAEINSKSIPVWSFPGMNEEESLSIECPKLADGYSGIRVEIDVATQADSTPVQYQDVYAVYFSQWDSSSNKVVNKLDGSLVRTCIPSGQSGVRTIELESCYPAKSGLPINIKIERKSKDPADSFNSPTMLTEVRIVPVKDTQETYVVEESQAYNSWPMIQELNGKLVCVYSRGSGHSYDEGKRGTYARTSTDGGKTWTAESVVVNNIAYGEVPIGKGLDINGDMLVWVRSAERGKGMFHDLYRTKDGITFTHVATPKLSPMPMQITDVFQVPNVGLMALWFTGNYGEDKLNSWGIVVSDDNGRTWTQRTIESKLTQTESPTEQSAVYLGDGKILAICRTEYKTNTTKRAQFQLESNDYGATWNRYNTNISDVFASTPSLIFDENTGLLSNYYYQRGRGMLKRRVAKVDEIWGNPMAWSNPEIMALGSAASIDAGNVNAVAVNGKHFLSYYSGAYPKTSVLVSVVKAPGIEKTDSE